MVDFCVAQWCGQVIFLNVQKFLKYFLVIFGFFFFLKNFFGTSNIFMSISESSEEERTY